MIIGSHNSWSYLPVKQWYLKPLAFIAKCQSVDIKTQYEKYGVRCFDLRVRFSPIDGLIIAHGIFEYKCSGDSWNYLANDLEYLNSKKDCFVRVIHEVRIKKQYTTYSKDNFIYFCKYISDKYKGIRFWCGRNLYNWAIDYYFGEEPSCEEDYSSVKYPKIIDDWWPWLYAKLHNKKIKTTDKSILMIDFVNLR